MDVDLFILRLDVDFRPLHDLIEVFLCELALDVLEELTDGVEDALMFFEPLLFVDGHQRSVRS